MMKYEVFKEMVIDSFKDYLPEQYRELEMMVEPVNKPNCILDGITIIIKDSGTLCFPTIYINHMYENYKEHGSFEKAVKESADFMAEALRTVPEIPQIEPEDVKANIIFELLNTQQNEALLADVPHRKFQDLSVVYRYILKMESEGTSSILMTHGIAERLGITEGELFELAMENTRRLLPPFTKTLNEVMRDVFINDGMPEDIADTMTEQKPDDCRLHVVTNEKKFYGAATMLYEDVFHELAEKLDSDLYILPSSIHELLVVSAASSDVNELAQMVYEVNMNSVVLEERLSNQVYFYDKDLRKVSIATDTPHKRLDVMVAEQGMVYEAEKHR